MIKKLTFIGLGQMGRPMAENLIAAGYQVTGYDKCQRARSLFTGDTEISISSALKEADFVVTMLPNGGDVKEALLNNDNFLNTSNNCIFVDMSSSSPFDTVSLDKSLKNRSGLLDAPVSGGVKRAIDGSLTIMIGGSKNIYLQHKRLFNALASKVFYCGALGSGHALKGLNNYVSAAGLIASCEALIAAEKFGISPDLFIELLNHSTGKNDATENKLKRFVTSKKFNSGFSLNLQTKDINNVMVFSKNLGLELSGLTKISEILTSAQNNLSTEVDHTEIYKFLKNSKSRNPPVR